MVGHADSGGELLARFLADVQDLPVAEIAPHLRVSAHADAAQRLFRIAAGLDPLILGEDWYPGPAQGCARRGGGGGHARPGLAPTRTRRPGDRQARPHRHRDCPGEPLGCLGRPAGGEWTLGHAPRPARPLIGAGDTAELALKHLRKESNARPARLLLTNRTWERARALATRYDAEALPWDAREQALAEADLVISCTSAPETVLDAPAFARAIAQRPERPLLCYDLAVPRDIAPAAGAVPGVTLRVVDDLAAAGEAARQQRQAAVADAEAIVATETARFIDWWRARAVAPAIVALRSHAEAIRDTELARALARLNELTPREEAVVRDLAGAIVNKLLHRPVTTLKAAPEGANMARVVYDLFDLPLPSIPALHTDADSAPADHAHHPVTFDFQPSTFDPRS